MEVTGSCKLQTPYSVTSTTLELFKAQAHVVNILRPLSTVLEKSYPFSCPYLSGSSSRRHNSSADMSCMSLLHALPLL